MRILITGSKGTLGRPLQKKLVEKGNDVYGCDLTHDRDEKYMRCDISEYRQIEKVIDEFKPEIIYNLAAEFGRINGEEYYEKVWGSNVIGLRNILEIQKTRGFKLIHASSSEIYGDLHAEYFDERAIPAPQSNDYAISKWVNELQCKNFRARHGNQIMVLRFFNAYGPGEFYTPYRSVVCLFVFRALHNKPYTVFEGYYRVFMYIDDFIDTLAKTSENFIDGEVVNIGGKEYRSVKDLSDLILKALGKDDSNVEYISKDHHNVVCKRPNIKKSIKLFGHDPKTTLEEGILRTIEWQRKIYGV